MKKIKNNYKTYAIFNCGCEIEIPKYGISNGIRCDIHKELLSNKIIYKPLINMENT
jgi:hypothetical protein